MNILTFTTTFITTSIAVLKTPYTYIDYNFVHENNIFINDPAQRMQIATRGQVALLSDFATSETLANDGSTIGVFECENGVNKYSAAFLPALTYNSFSLEVVSKMNSLYTIFDGFIIGIEDTWDNTQGNAISFNEIEGKVSDEKNKFFGANIVSDGWHATKEYWDSVYRYSDIELDTFYHIIISQDSSGLVRVYVNGFEYGSSYQASGGGKANGLVFPTIWICGDYRQHIGIDASVAVWGFYTESFDNNDDAKDSCLEAGLTDCDGIPLMPTNAPTASPTMSPIVECEKGQNYFLDGVPAYVTGDPHFRTFNGDIHDFMGRSGQQYYYMHPCLTSTRNDMPFSILGYHYRVGTSSITGLDYITIELYDGEGTGGDKYYIWLSTSIHSFANVNTNPLSLYDANPGQDMISGQEYIIGTRFKAKYIQTSTSRIDFTLTIRDSCSVTLYMQAQRFEAGRYRMHYLQVKPSACFLCHTCGLFGDLKRGPIPGVNGFMRTCNGAAVFYKSGWSSTNPIAYDFNGWGWAKFYVNNICANNWSNRRRNLLMTDTDIYQFEIEDNFQYINPCNPLIKQDAINKCEIARNGENECCNLIGGGFCDELQDKCEFDACANVMDNVNLIDEQVYNLFNKPLQLVCSLPDAAEQLHPSKILCEYPECDTPLPSPIAKPAKCSHILWSGNVWGKEAKGVLLGAYTNDELQFIGCPTDGCHPNTFYCTQTHNSITFGTQQHSAMRSLVGSGQFPTFYDGCCDINDKRGLCNSPDEQISVNKLCQQLGYTRGTFVFVESNSCPEPHYHHQLGWINDFNNDQGYGQSYTCIIDQLI